MNTTTTNFIFINAKERTITRVPNTGEPNSIFCELLECKNSLDIDIIFPPILFKHHHNLYVNSSILIDRSEDYIPGFHINSYPTTIGGNAIATCSDRMGQTCDSILEPREILSWILWIKVATNKRRLYTF